MCCCFFRCCNIIRWFWLFDSFTHRIYVSVLLLLLFIFDSLVFWFLNFVVFASWYVWMLLIFFYIHFAKYWMLNYSFKVYGIFLFDSNSGWNQRTAKIVLPFYFCCNGKKNRFSFNNWYELLLLHSSIDAQAVTARRLMYVFFRLIRILIFLTKNSAKFYWWNGTDFKLMNSYKCICYWIKYRKWAIRCIA